jgi:hypothetical protein
MSSSTSQLNVHLSSFCSPESQGGCVQLPFLEMATPNASNDACYKLAKLCQALFKSYVASPPIPDPSYAEEQQARFNIWAANIGVFAEERASLDYRLQEDEEVRAMVIQLLDLIHRNLGRGMFISVT